MTQNPEAQLLARLRPICSDVYDLLEEAAVRGGKNLSIYEDPDPAALTNFTRFHFQLSLRDKELPGWRMRPDVNNGGTHLVTEDSMVVMRFRHKPGVPLPPTGLSRAQRRYWRQEFMDGLFPDKQNLVAAWYIDRRGEAHIEIYRPRDVWGYEGKEVVDLRFDLPRDPDGFDNLEWAPMEEHLSDEMFMDQAQPEPAVSADDDD